jgi:hypothetical protein
MKTIVAGLMLLLLFLVPDPSLAGSEGCARDFWGKCKGDSWGNGNGNGNGFRYTSYRYRHCAKDFWGRCADGRPRWRSNNGDNGHHHHHHHAGRGDVDRGAFCQPRRRVVGIERTSKAQARRAADDAWMGAVRYDHGERFQDLNHAKDVRHNCDPSTPVSPAVLIKKVYFRCVVEATPCRGPTGTSEERYERRYEEDDSDDDK